MSKTFDPENYAKVPALAVTPKPPQMVEWIAVSDTQSEVLMSDYDRNVVVKFANKVRRAGGEVTIFRSTKL